MTLKNQYIILTDEANKPVRLLLVDTGDVDTDGNPIYRLGADAQVDVTVDSATLTGPLPAGMNNIGFVSALDDGFDPNLAQVIGINGAAFSSADQHSAAAAVISAPGGGKKAVITDISVSVGIFAGGLQKVTFTEETSGTVILVLEFATAGSFAINFRGKLKLATNVKRLMVQTSVAGQIDVTALWYSE